MIATISPRRPHTATIGLDRFDSIDLATLNEFAQLQTRKDRKYVLSATALTELLAVLPLETCCLETNGRRWFGYESTYFDTEDLDAYRMAATRRRRRFKVRSRTYVDSCTTFAEVKTKNSRGRTVKHRRPIGYGSPSANDSILDFAAEFDDVAPYADALAPVLQTSYLRATLVLPDHGVRATIDGALRCVDQRGRETHLSDSFIIETKTSGQPSIVDHLLWSAGHRPKKISKYATCLAALRPELPANRWRPVLRQHFENHNARIQGTSK